MNGPSRNHLAGNVDIIGLRDGCSVKSTQYTCGAPTDSLNSWTGACVCTDGKVTACSNNYPYCLTKLTKNTQMDPGYYCQANINDLSIKTNVQRKDPCIKCPTGFYCDGIFIEYNQIIKLLIFITA